VASPLATQTVTARLEEGEVLVWLGDLPIRAELARTPEERAQGLSDRPSMPEDAGMLFVYAEDTLPTYCMCGMRFALDFVWIGADGAIVDIDEGIPAPPPDTSDSLVARIRPDSEVRYVLEVNAGVVDAAGIAVGDVVRFEPRAP
jgi:uncharacterized membrane protein (UPF0127 family)